MESTRFDAAAKTQHPYNLAKMSYFQSAVENMKAMRINKVSTVYAANATVIERSLILLFLLDCMLINSSPGSTGSPLHSPFLT